MSVDVSIHYDHCRDTAYGGVLSMNLKDLVRAFELKGFLSHHPNAECTGVFAPGLVKLNVNGVLKADVYAVLEAFRKSMAKNGFKLLFSYTNSSYKAAA